MSNTIRIGLCFELHERNYTLSRFREGIAVITCKQTEQEQRISDKNLEKLLTKKVI